MPVLNFQLYYCHLQQKLVLSLLSHLFPQILSDSLPGPGRDGPGPKVRLQLGLMCYRLRVRDFGVKILMRPRNRPIYQEH